MSELPTNTWREHHVTADECANYSAAHYSTARLYNYMKMDDIFDVPTWNIKYGVISVAPSQCVS